MNLIVSLFWYWVLMACLSIFWAFTTIKTMESHKDIKVSFYKKVITSCAVLLVLFFVIILILFISKYIDVLKVYVLNKAV